jgi:hypothetical protein
MQTGILSHCGSPGSSFKIKFATHIPARKEVNASRDFIAILPFLLPDEVQPSERSENTQPAENNDPGIAYQQPEA